jgi:hypothetical protein
MAIAILPTVKNCKEMREKLLNNLCAIVQLVGGRVREKL